MAESPAEGAVKEAALACLARGWSVIPIRRADKRPLIRWEEFQHRRPAPEEVRGWYGQWPEANIAIVTGPVSGLVVVDVDPGHGGQDSLDELERRHGALPLTVEALTGGGGRHIYFCSPPVPVGNRAGIVPGIDLRGAGGYVVAPPSLHASGRRYAWEVSHHPDEVALAPMPDWLLRLVGGEEAHHGHPRMFWRELVRKGVNEGERNSRLAQLAGHLLWHDVDAEVVLELLLAWNAERCRPPLDPAEVAATVDSILRLRRRQDALAGLPPDGREGH